MRRRNAPFKSLAEIKARCKVTKQGCWKWQHHVDTAGYGQRWLNRKMVLIHREAYAVKNGPIPNGMDVCHKCDHPPCVNPDHLFLGGASENCRDAVKKGRHKCNKIKYEQVPGIRKLLAAGISQTAIAKQFGVWPSTISDINTRNTWDY